MNQTYQAHDHVFLGVGHEKNERRTWMVIVLCGLMMVAEIIAALAYTYARKLANDSRFTFGTGKLGDLAGFTSAIILAMIAMLIAYEAISRLLQPVAIHFAEAIP